MSMNRASSPKGAGIVVGLVCVFHTLGGICVDMPAQAGTG
jgi:hypothetical protein